MATTISVRRAYTVTDDWGDAAPVLEGVVAGILVDIDPAGVPLVEFSDNHNGVLPARSLVAVTSAARGREVALLFERNNPTKPIIVGLFQTGDHAQAADHGRTPAPSDLDEDSDSVDATVDGERVIVTAGKEIVFRCGKASIVLTRAGKILIRGTYVLSDSSSVNRIRGGAVQIN